MFALAMMALVLIVVALGASFFSHLRDFSSDVYDKVRSKTKKPADKKDTPSSDSKQGKHGL